jgi:V8-like Glu-specific endopeptidase
MPTTLVPETDVLKEGTPDRTAASTVLAPQQFGTAGLPYTTSQVNAFGDDTDVHYPFRAAGKVFYNNQLGQTFVCSAALIKRAIVVTAAHCVAEFGARLFFSNWQFVPAYNNGQAPFGVSAARQAFVVPSWFDGTDPCAGGPGIACPNDVAVVTLNPLSGGDYVGSLTGWLGVGADGYGFTPSSTTQVTQLGYPSALDGGAVMERNDSLGYVDPSMSYNTIIGSLMTGGSSGGPWVLNLGRPPSLSGTNYGQAAEPNLVVGVTSWGVVAPDDVKAQGASPFASSNVFALLAAACTATPSACQ